LQTEGGNAQRPQGSKRGGPWPDCEKENQFINIQKGKWSYPKKLRPDTYVERLAIAIKKVKPPGKKKRRGLGIGPSQGKRSGGK